MCTVSLVPAPNRILSTPEPLTQQHKPWQKCPDWHDVWTNRVLIIKHFNHQQLFLLRNYSDPKHTFIKNHFLINYQNLQSLMWLFDLLIQSQKDFKNTNWTQRKFLLGTDWLKWDKGFWSHNFPVLLLFCFFLCQIEFSYLIQQWVEFLDQTPSSVLLQFSHSRKHFSKNHQATKTLNQQLQQLRILFIKLNLTLFKLCKISLLVWIFI